MTKLQPVDFQTFETLKKFKDMFEIQPCGRCGGSGRYSWCQMYGDTCFKCEGSGLAYTTRGRKMLVAYLEQRKIEMKDAQVGQRLHGFGYKFTVAEVLTIDGDTTLVTADGKRFTSDSDAKIERVGVAAEERYQHYLNTFQAVKTK